MKLRLEFWTMTGTTGVPLLRSMIADAVEFEADTNPIALPVAPNRAAYAMSVFAVEGGGTVQVGLSDDAGEYDAARGRLVLEGTESWFIVQPDSYIVAAEYEAA